MPGGREEGRIKLVGIQGIFQRDKWAFTEINKAEMGEEHSRWGTACRKAGTLDSSYCLLMPTLLGSTGSDATKRLFEIRPKRGIFHLAI